MSDRSSRRTPESTWAGTSDLRATRCTRTPEDRQQEAWGTFVLLLGERPYSGPCCLGSLVPRADGPRARPGTGSPASLGGAETSTQLRRQRRCLISAHAQRDRAAAGTPAPARMSPGPGLLATAGGGAGGGSRGEDGAAAPSLLPRHTAAKSSLERPTPPPPPLQPLPVASPSDAVPSSPARGSALVRRRGNQGGGV